MSKNPASHRQKFARRDSGSMVVHLQPRRHSINLLSGTGGAYEGLCAQCAPEDGRQRTCLWDFLQKPKLCIVECIGYEYYVDDFTVHDQKLTSN
ncbi:hypothetical protein M8J77_022694 [Diaphorina citri]|nr:hypothetical protein M8J77_022694 [Diaphorina citri]